MGCCLVFTVSASMVPCPSTKVLPPLLQQLPIHCMGNIKEKKWNLQVEMREWIGLVSDATEIKYQRDLLVLNQTRSWESCFHPSNLRPVQRNITKKSTSKMDSFTVFVWITGYNLSLFLFLFSWTLTWASVSLKTSEEILQSTWRIGCSHWKFNHWTHEQVNEGYFVSQFKFLNQKVSQTESAQLCF